MESLDSIIAAAKPRPRVRALGAVGGGGAGGGGGGGGAVAWSGGPLAGLVRGGAVAPVVARRLGQTGDVPGPLLGDAHPSASSPVARAPHAPDVCDMSDGRRRCRQPSGDAS